MTKKKPATSNLLPAHIAKLLGQLIAQMVPPAYHNFDSKRVVEVIVDLVKFNIGRVDVFLRKLIDRVANRDEMFDVFREGRFARVLARNGFSNIILEPFDSSVRGPDIEAMYKKELVYFEITRRREAEGEWELDVTNDLESFSQDKVDNIVSRILTKTKQLKKGYADVVVLWSDTIRIDTPEMDEAFNKIIQEINSEPFKYSEMSAVLFTSGGVSIPDIKQFYLYINPYAEHPLSPCIRKRLEKMTEKDRKYLKRKFDSLGKALKRRKLDNTQSLRQNL